MNIFSSGHCRVWTTSILVPGHGSRVRAPSLNGELLSSEFLAYGTEIVYYSPLAQYGLQGWEWIETWTNWPDLFFFFFLASSEYVSWKHRLKRVTVFRLLTYRSIFCIGNKVVQHFGYKFWANWLFWSTSMKLGRVTELQVLSNSGCGGIPRGGGGSSVFKTMLKFANLCPPREISFLHRQLITADKSNSRIAYIFNTLQLVSI